MFEFLAGFIVGMNVGISVWSLLCMASIQAPDPSKRGLASEGVQDPARATSDPAMSDPDWSWATLGLHHRMSSPTTQSAEGGRTCSASALPRPHGTGVF